MPEDMLDRMPEDLPDRMPEDMPDRMPEDVPDKMPEDMPDRMPEDMPEHMPEDMPDRMPEDMPDRMPEDMPEDMPDRMPEDMPDRMCINVMVGITRSKVIFCFCFLSQYHLPCICNSLELEPVICMVFASLYEFTGSGWGLWLSSRKCRLYKLETHLATDIKPIWGILENGNVQEVHFRSYV